MSENSWYLPHFRVTNPKKPGKFRFVFDAAARVNGACLNDNLLKGPDLLNFSLGVMFKFRQKRITLAGDFQKKFNQIHIRENERNARRYFWWDEGEKVMIIGTVSSPTSSTYIMRKNAREFEQEFPEAVRIIVEQHYVDDHLDSVDSFDEALKIISDVIEVHRKCGFIIRNSKDVLEEIPIDLRTEK